MMHAALSRSPRDLLLGGLALSIAILLPMNSAKAQVLDVESINGVPGGAPVVHHAFLRRGAEWCRGWNMESRVARSQLILVARVSNVSALRVVRGAKVNTAHREYRFQPVRVLKGVFARDELSMTHTDLGLPAPDPASPPAFEQGQFLLLLLARNSGSYSCVGTGQWMPPRQLLPQIAGPDDPIVSMTATMIRITESPSRRQRADLALEQVQQLSGPALVPLLSSLSGRAYWAAQNPSAETLVDLMNDSSSAIRAAATSAIARILQTGSVKDDDAIRKFAGALRGLLESEDVETQVRVSALRGVGHLGDVGRDTDWAGKLLTRHLRRARTHAERRAAATALADLNDREQLAAMLEALDRLPLDEDQKREQAFVLDVVRMAGEDASPVLVRRVQRKLVADHRAYIEIAQLGKLKYAEAVPTLMQAAQDGRHYDEQQLATAFAQLRDERTIGVLSRWLLHQKRNVRWAAFNALDAIDNEQAVAAIRLRLKSEPDLRLKLRMAGTLGRHGITDGYPYAIEHLADPGITQYAAKALAAIGDERTNAQLWKILDTSHDGQWNAGALRGLATLGDAKVKQRLVDILADRRHSLVAAAITAAIDLGDAEMIPALTPLVSSRNYNVASSSVEAIKNLSDIEGPKPPGFRQAIREAGAALLSLLDDPDVNVKLRASALDALELIEDNRLAEAVRRLADRSELESTELMTRIDRYLASVNSAG